MEEVSGRSANRVLAAPGRRMRVAKGLRVIREMEIENIGL